MLSITHTLTSLPFAALLNHPLLIFTAAFILHLLADTLPHWNIYYDERRSYPFVLVAIDIIGGLSLAWWFSGSALLTLPYLAAIAGGNAPDILHGIWDLASAGQRRRAPWWMQRWFSFHDRLQLETTQVLPGLVAQVALVGLAVALI